MVQRESQNREKLHGFDCDEVFSRDHKRTRLSSTLLELECQACRPPQTQLSSS